jgi:hypothetical protein
VRYNLFSYRLYTMRNFDLDSILYLICNEYPRYALTSLSLGLLYRFIQSETAHQYGFHLGLFILITLIVICLIGYVVSVLERLEHLPSIMWVMTLPYMTGLLIGRCFLVASF